MSVPAAMIDPIDRRGSLTMPMKVGVIIKLIERDGWVLVATRGSHRQYRHPTKPGRVTIPGKPSRELSHALEKSILTQAGLTRRDAT
jgi:predicted RNA binding protein YcfA (HicA-like mRNA interferase family)